LFRLEGGTTYGRTRKVRRRRRGSRQIKVNQGRSRLRGGEMKPRLERGWPRIYRGDRGSYCKKRDLEAHRGVPKNGAEKPVFWLQRKYDQNATKYDLGKKARARFGPRVWDFFGSRSRSCGPGTGGRRVEKFCDGFAAWPRVPVSVAAKTGFEPGRFWLSDRHLPSV